MLAAGRFGFTDSGGVDRQVVLRKRRIVEPAGLFGDLADGRPLEARAIREDLERSPLVIRASDANFATLRIRSPPVPLKGRVIEMKEVANGMGQWTSELAENLHHG